MHSTRHARAHAHDCEHGDDASEDTSLGRGTGRLHIEYSSVNLRLPFEHIPGVYLGPPLHEECARSLLIRGESGDHFWCTCPTRLSMLKRWERERCTPRPAERSQTKLMAVEPVRFPPPGHGEPSVMRIIGFPSRNSTVVFTSLRTRYEGRSGTFVIVLTPWRSLDALDV